MEWKFEYIEWKFDILNLSLNILNEFEYIEIFKYGMSLFLIIWIYWSLNIWNEVWFWI